MMKKKQTTKRKSKQTPKGSGFIRIIAGQWRGRKLPVVSVQGLRPTPNRVRETLFNWLQAHIHQARCLDLFAGSGAIGFEAASRGAEHVVMVEKHHKAAQQLRQNLKTINADNISIKNTDAYHYLESKPEPFNIIFLDPPFRKGHLNKILDQIINNQLLLKDGFIYLEQELENQLDFSQWGLHPHKQTKAGQLEAFLLILR